MALPRIRIAKEKAELVKALVDFNGAKGPFQTYADAIIFAAALGAKYNKRVPLVTISNTEPAPISLEIFISRGYDTVIKLLAIAQTKDPQILSTHDLNAEEQRVQIFEEYANGGLEKLRDELRGAVDYTDRLLLILSEERFEEEATNEEFDLSRFL
ncbi:MAG: DNA phosphorothioation-associated protein 4 [Hydrococcus sp. C42_A2020_068]|uniref:DNA phosphorothioation-associated protein 4 n=1 Tax=Pleurocapsa sp. PCC 7327 TaxID=118163 RepID=UPI00029FF943|nr:DNA phosphorothioation-associated protein 4 [Pleurocapsa sp. PCC 7327]AFY79576.1 dnd system-associated protein 4 [Pleurocapsa sp. PCC 7327]MBF2021151.1 DNA phosphorothioation-associated protein 4 [Hydrococcus sp. C42_A2020_068]